MADFSGTYYHQVDDKMRFRIPAVLREELGKSYVVTAGANNSLLVMTVQDAEKEFKVFDDITIETAFMEPQRQKRYRQLKGNSTTLTEDGQGRTILPQNLVKHANIKKDIVIVGVGKFIEVWSLENHNKYWDIQDE